MSQEPLLHRMRRFITLLVVAGLSAVAPTARVAANPINDQIAALPEEQRRVIFARMLQREGERCHSVTRTFFQGSSSDGAAFWSIACSGGKDWQIMIKNTAPSDIRFGDIRFLECSVLKAIGGGTCFTKFKR